MITQSPADSREEGAGPMGTVMCERTTSLVTQEGWRVLALRAFLGAAPKERSVSCFSC